MNTVKILTEPEHTAWQNLDLRKEFPALYSIIDDIKSGEKRQKLELIINQNET